MYSRECDLDTCLRDLAFVNLRILTTRVLFCSTHIFTVYIYTFVYIHGKKRDFWLQNRNASSPIYYGLRGFSTLYPIFLIYFTRIHQFSNNLTVAF